MRAIRTRIQPQGRGQVDRSNPLTRGIAFAINPGAGGVSDVIGRRSPVLNGVSRVAGNRGVGYIAASNASVGAQFAGSPMSTSDGAGTGEFTYLVIAAPVASGAREFFVCSQNGAQEFYFGANFSSPGLAANAGYVSAETNSGGASGVAVAGVADGKPHAFAYTRGEFAGGAATGRLYVDGVLRGTNTAVSLAQMWASNSSDYIGGYAGAGWGVSGNVYLVLGWNRALSADEIAEVSANPWQLFQAPQRLTLVASAPVEGGGGLAADLSVTLSAATLAASASAAVAANASMPLQPTVLAGAASNANAGGLAVTLSAASANSTATNAGTSNLNKSLAPTTLASSAGSEVQRSADLSVALAPVSVSASASAGIAAGLSKTLAPAQIGAAAAAGAKADMAASLAAATLTASAQSAIGAGAAIALRGVQLYAQGQVFIAGSLAKTLNSTILSASAGEIAEVLNPNQRMRYVGRARVRTLVGRERVRVMR